MDRIQQLDETGLFDALVPRYTSYPTSPHFSADITGTDFERWLQALPDRAGVSIYIHVPFCERLCWFCACRTQGVRSIEPVLAYTDTLVQELELLSRLGANRFTVERVHFGGGTPTILPPPQIARICEQLHRTFSIRADAEFSVEIDPTLVDRAKIKAFRQGGMTRASIGIQDFDPDIQQAIGRRQSFDRTAEVVADLRTAGIDSLNTDIVYGLPDQTRDGIRKSTDKVLSLDPDRVALFGYAHVPWVAKRQRMINPDSLPGPIDRLRLAEQTEAQFTAAGYLPIGIDHFARPGDALAAAALAGRLRRNFQGYTDDSADALIGLGASAISEFPQGYTQNAPATAAYTGRIRAGQHGTARGYALGLADRIRGRFIERFLCDLTIDTSAAFEDFGTFAELLQPDITRVIDRFAPWLDIDGTRITLRPEGKALARLIASEFDAYLPAGTTRHSSAI